jgi:hypothetical protein
MIKLTVDSCSQNGSGLPKCCNDQTNCFLCNCESLLTSFHSQFSQHESIDDKEEQRKDIDLLPCSLVIIKYIQWVSTSWPIRALFDGGSDTTFIHEGCLPPGATSRLIPGQSGQTLAGLLHANRFVELQELIIPEFSCSSCVDNQLAFVFQGQCDYDIIFGQDFLWELVCLMIMIKALWLPLASRHRWNIRVSIQILSMHKQTLLT